MRSTAIFEGSYISKFATSALTIAEMEARKIRHDSTELWMRSIQPALWLLIFGEVFNTIRGLHLEEYHTSNSSRQAFSPNPCCSSRFSMAFSSFGREISEFSPNFSRLRRHAPR